jgi:hypothetical protein
VRPVGIRGITLALGLTLASGAAAQEQNPQALPVGEEALGLGGAYTGRASDASASFYNPAGLGFGRQGALSASLSLGLVDRYVLAGAREDYALEFSDAFGVPFYVGAAAQVGDAMADGRPRHAIAASTLTPSSSRRRFVIERQSDGDVSALRIRRDDVTRWYGLSYAFRIIEQLGVGLTLFLTTRSFSHEEQELETRGGRELAVRATRAELSSEHLVLRFGTYWQVDPRFSLGLMLQFPSIEVGSRGTVGSVLATSVGTGFDTGFTLEENVGARSPVPWQGRLGLAWSPLDELTLVADLTVTGPLGSPDDPVVRFEPPRPLAPGAAGLYLATEWWSDWTVDVALGTRFVVEQRVPVSVGLFTALSSAPDILDGPTAVYQPDRLDLFGASLNVGYQGDNFELTVGVVATFGFGRGLRAVSPTGLGSTLYEPAGLESQTLHVFVTGAGGAIEAFGRTIAQEIERWTGPSVPEPERREPSDGASPVEPELAESEERE